ncbi:MAG: hypothetical protein ABIJ59_16415 [Pseudomonadota bacterium]
MENIKICSSIKQYFQECGFEITNEENTKNIYRLESYLERHGNDFTLEIMHHKKPMTITIQIKTNYKFNKKELSKTLLLVDLINMVSMNIGCVGIDPETNKISITSNLYLSHQGLDECQFKTTLELIFIQMQFCHALVQKVDRDTEDPLKVISDFHYEVRQAMELETGDQFDFADQYFVDIPRGAPFKDDSELVVMDMQLCLQDEGLPILNETERQADTEMRPTKIIGSWCKIESGVFQVQAFYTPEANIVGIEIGGFSPIKDESASNYIYLFNWINQMQMRNWWVLCPEINRILFRGGFVISNGKLDKYQFRKLIKSSIENLKLFYPLVVNQEKIGKNVVDSILRFSGDNIINIGRFHNN